ncbi:hypothetical protein HBA55_11965 [Pseudomaricurvus alkylphenolicus]|nr:hypothetical protein [Pseudomaricurvus alkylphenolicus]NIB40307.1 hypothetical protein [Pseudomaricurvus alkylphenolicus]
MLFKGPLEVFPGDHFGEHEQWVSGIKLIEEISAKEARLLVLIGVH